MKIEQIVIQLKLLSIDQYHLNEHGIYQSGTTDSISPKTMQTLLQPL